MCSRNSRNGSDVADLQRQSVEEWLKVNDAAQNCDKMKTENNRLASELCLMQSKITSMTEEKNRLVERHKLVLDQCRRDLAAKHCECEDYKAKMPSPHALEKLKTKIREELERSNNEKMASLNCEVEKYRERLNCTARELSALRTEFQLEKTGNAKLIEELKMAHKCQLECLRKEKDNAACRQSNLAGSDHEACLRRQTQRENAQLKVRITQLLKELEETRVANRQGCPSPDCVTRLQAKQIAKHVEQNRTLQHEKDTLLRRVETLQCELRSSQECAKQLSNNIRDIEREKMQLACQAEETALSAKLETTNECTTLTREKGKLEMKCRQLEAELADTTADLDTSRTCISQYASVLAEKERDFAKRQQVAKEENRKCRQFSEAKIAELEMKIEKVASERFNLETQRMCGVEEGELKPGDSSSDSDKSNSGCPLKPHLKPGSCSNEGQRAEMDLLREQLQCERKFYKDLQARLASADEQLKCERGFSKDLKARLESAEKQLQCERDAGKDMKARLELAEKQFKDELEASKDMKARFDSAEKQLQDELVAGKDMKARLESAEKQFQSELEAGKDMKARLYSAEKQLQCELESSKNMKARLVSAEKQLQNELEACTDMKARLDSAEKQLQCELESSKNMKARLVSAEKQLQNELEADKDMKARLDSAEKQLQNELYASKDMKARLESAEKQFQSECGASEDLKARLESCEKHLQSELDASKAVKSRLESCEKQLQCERNVSKNLKVRLELSEKQFQSECGASKDLQARLESLEEQLLREHSLSVDLTSRLESAEKQLQCERKSCKDLKAQLESAKDELQSERRSSKDIRSCLESAEDQLKGECNSSKDLMARLKSAEDQLKGECNSSKDLMARLKSAEDQLKGECKSSKDLMARLKSAEDQLKSECNSSKDLMARLESAEDQLKGECNSSKDLMARSESAEHQLRRERKSSKDLMARLEAAEKRQTDDDDLRERFMEATKRNKQFEQLLQCERDKNAELTSQLDSLCRQSRNMEEQLQGEIINNQSLQGRLEKKRTQNERISEEMEVSRVERCAEHLELECEVKNLRRKLQCCSDRLSTVQENHEEQSRGWSSTECQLSHRVLTLEADLEEMKFKQSTKQPDNDVYRRKYCDILQRHEIFDRILKSVSSEILPDLSHLDVQSIPNYSEAEPCLTVPDPCHYVSRTHRQATGDRCYDNREANVNARTRVNRTAPENIEMLSGLSFDKNFPPRQTSHGAIRQKNGEIAKRRSRDQLEESTRVSSTATPMERLVYREHQRGAPGSFSSILDANFQADSPCRRDSTTAASNATSSPSMNRAPQRAAGRLGEVKSPNDASHESCAFDERRRRDSLVDDAVPEFSHVNSNESVIINRPSLSARLSSAVTPTDSSTNRDYYQKGARSDLVVDSNFRVDPPCRRDSTEAAISNITISSSRMNRDTQRTTGRLNDLKSPNVSHESYVLGGGRRRHSFVDDVVSEFPGVNSNDNIIVSRSSLLARNLPGRLTSRSSEKTTGRQSLRGASQMELLAGSESLTRSRTSPPLSCARSRARRQENDDDDDDDERCELSGAGLIIGSGKLSERGALPVSLDDNILGASDGQAIQDVYPTTARQSAASRHDQRSTRRCQPSDSNVEQR